MQAADALIKVVPNPHKVRFCLALDAKNVGVVLRDADLDTAAAECALGALSYNGQRCTALKLLLVHKVPPRAWRGEGAQARACGREGGWSTEGFPR